MVVIAFKDTSGGGMAIETDVGATTPPALLPLLVRVGGICRGLSEGLVITGGNGCWGKCKTSNGFACRIFPADGNFEVVDEVATGAVVTETDETDEVVKLVWLPPVARTCFPPMPPPLYLARVDC